MAGGRNILLVRQTGLRGSRNIVSLCNALAEAGIRASLAVLDGSSERCGLDERVGYISVSGGRMRAGLQLRRLIEESGDSIIYVIDSWTIPAFFIATFGSLMVRGKKTVYHTFDWLEPGQVGWWHTSLERSLCRKANLVVNTDKSRARMQQTLYQLDAAPLWIQNSLSIRDRLPDVDGSARREMLGGGDSDDKIVIYPTLISRDMAEERCVPQLVKAFKDLGPGYRLILFGREGRGLAGVKEIVAEMGLQGRVMFLSPKPFEELMRYTATADMGVILYDDTRSSGYFMCNADKLSLFAACGIPYIASAFPNLESVTYKHNLGRCCNASDPGDIARAIKDLTAEVRDKEAHRRRIRAAFEEHICIERHIGPLVAALEQM